MKVSDNLYFARSGNVVTCSVYHYGVSLGASWGSAKLADIPSGMLPAYPVRCAAQTFNRTACVAVVADVSGELRAENAGGTAYGDGQICANLTWVSTS